MGTEMSTAAGAARARGGSARGRRRRARGGSARAHRCNTPSCCSGRSCPTRCARRLRLPALPAACTGSVRGCARRPRNLSLAQLSLDLSPNSGLGHSARKRDARALFPALPGPAGPPPWCRHRCALRHAAPARLLRRKGCCALTLGARAWLLLRCRCRRRLRTSAATRSSTAAAARARPTTGAAPAAVAAWLRQRGALTLLRRNRARLRLTIQDKNKYNSPKYRLVVRFVRARPPQRAAAPCVLLHTLGFRPRAPLPRRPRAARRRRAAARRMRRR